MESGLSADIVLWNSPPSLLREYDGIVIPGGFSFEDRGRSGVVAAAEPIMDTVREMAAEGKPVLGICNGAQILVESGLVPGFTPGKVEMALARNERVKDGEILGTGYYHNWIHIRPTGRKTPFSLFQESISLPIAHGEGRFFTDPRIEDHIEKNHQIVFQYCREDGKVVSGFPVNPNGAFSNAAGICNAQGNVLALMPHPERSPHGHVVFDSLTRYLKSPQILVKKKVAISDLEREHVEKYKPCHIELFVRLKITDNAEKTLERVARKKWGSPVSTERFTFWGINVAKGVAGADFRPLAESIIRSGELLNDHKERVSVRIGGHWFSFDKNTGLRECLPPEWETPFLSFERKDIIGESFHHKIRKHVKGADISSVSHGIFWNVTGVSFQDAANDTLFANPYSEYLVPVNR